jgi:hypothetical protein
MDRWIADVCRAYETIKRRGKAGKDATKRGDDLIEARGWLAVDELADVNAACQVERHGVPAHPPKTGRVLPLRQARALVRRLLARWAEELAP